MKLTRMWVPRWLSRLRRSAYGETLLASVIFASLIVLFYFRYLFLYHGYAGWANLLLPLSTNGLKWSIFFSAAGSSFTPITTPESSFFSRLFVNPPLWVFGHAFGMNVAGRISVVLTTVAAMVSAFLVTGQITRSFDVRLGVVLFLFFSPLGIDILTGGQVSALTSMSFVFLAIYFLLKDTNSNLRFPSVWFTLSVVFLAFSIFTVQGFILSVVVYSVVFFVFKMPSLSSRELLSRSSVTAIGKAVGSFLVALLLLVFFVLPDMVPLFAGNLNNGVYIAHLGLSNLKGNSAPTLQLLSLRFYSHDVAFASVSTLSPGLATIWSYLGIGLVLALVLLPFVLRDWRGVAVSAVVMFCALVGAAAESPLYPLTVYLYLHVPGFDAVNTAFQWEWWLVLPLYLVLFTQVGSAISRKLRPGRPPPAIAASSSSAAPGLPRLSKARPLSRAAIPALAIVLVVLLATPVATQGYYHATDLQSGGIYDTWSRELPSSYASIMERISSLGGTSTTGTAFFNPAPLLTFNNSDGWFLNPIVEFPQAARIASSEGYPSPTTPMGQFLYWVYALFYENETQYLGQLMSLDGIGWFVVLHGVSSYPSSAMPFANGVNATRLMSYQTGVRMVYQGPDYTIYRNAELNGGSAQVAANLTLVVGGEQELNVLPYWGIDLSDSATVLAGDLNPSVFRIVAPYVRTIVVPNLNSLYGVALASISDPIKLVDYAATGRSAGEWSSSWSYGYNSGFYPFDSPTPVALADGAATLKVRADVDEPGPYSIWIGSFTGNDLLYKWGSFQLTAGASSEVVNSSAPVEGTTNLFTWHRLSTYLTPGEPIYVKSLEGWNAVDRMFIVPTGDTSTAFTAINQTIQGAGAKVYQVVAGNQIAPTNGTHLQVQTGSTASPFAQLTELTASAGASGTAQLSPILPQPSMLLLQVSYEGFGFMIQVSQGSQTIQFGVHHNLPGDAANSTVDYVTIPLDHSERGRITLTVVQGKVLLAGLALWPETVLPANRAPITNASISAVLKEQATSNLSIKPSIERDLLTLRGSFNFVETSPSSGAIIGVYFSLPFPYNDSVFLSANVTAGYFLNVHNVYVGTTSPAGWYLSSDLVDSSNLSRQSTNSSLWVIVQPDRTPPLNASGRVSFTLDLGFFTDSSTFDYAQGSQYVETLPVDVNGVGYTVHDARTLTLVHLPYYSLMTTAPTGISRVSLDGGIAQLLILPSPATVSISVSYVDSVLTLSYAAFGVAVTFLAAGLVLNRKGSESSRSSTRTKSFCLGKAPKNPARKARKESRQYEQRN